VKWSVEVYGYDNIVVEADTESKARWKAYLAFCEAFGRQGFRSFLSRGVWVRRYAEVSP
jgi:hypothetical protein